ncbi:MAG: ATP-binding protein [Bacteroidales bacterium]|nr:ATP-binding protein [Bacteroidales bacterium]
MDNFKISNLGPLGKIDIDFGDLTILVGPQASGKSIALETLKLAIDRDSIIENLDRYNFIIGHNVDKILNVYYGSGMASMWKENTKIMYDGRNFAKGQIPLKPKTDIETMFYVPAQRILSISDGRPKFFMEFDNSAPYIHRIFSETLRLFMQNGLGKSDTIFPLSNRLKGHLKKSFDDSIFHGAKVVMEERDNQKKMLLQVDDVNIQFMSWSAGQKEFMPLLMAFYCLSGPPSKVIRKEKYKYVVIEEPEMGLHPRAIISVILQIIELMQVGGYKVIISTHSPVFLEFAWAFNLLKESLNKYDGLYELFDVPVGSPVRDMLVGLFEKNIKTYYFKRTRNGRVDSVDISSLDAGDTDSIVSEWGGLSAFASKSSEVVAKYLNDED